MQSENSRALSALQALDPGTNRETWVRIAMAAKDAGLDLADFTEWSSNAPNFGGDRECRVLWDSIREGGVTKATLFGMANNMGWKDPGKPRQAPLECIAASRPKSAAFRAVQRSVAPLRPRVTAMDLWEESLPADSIHPYIMRKSGSPQGLRVVAADSPVVVQGQQVAGWLVVPVRSLDGELRTLQLIPPHEGGRKLNLPGHQFEDGMFVLGDLVHAARIYVVEGIGQAWAAGAAGELAIVVTFGAGRMGTVAAIIRSRFPEAQVVIVSDRGKESESISIASKHACLWVAMPEGRPANFDLNDLLLAEGKTAVTALLKCAVAPYSRYRPKLAQELMRGPPLTWLVRGVIPASGLACIYGASGSGKTFLALDLCAAVARGAEWFGRKVTHAPVVYVALEGEHGLRQRAQAWQVHHAEDLPDRLLFVMDGLDLRSPDDRRDLARAITASGASGGMLVIDTLNRASGSADENSSRDMGEIVAAAKELQSALGGTVLLVHHSGKDQTKGLRGHSSLHAALDAAIEVTRTDSYREWRIAKNKDDGDAATHPFTLQVVELANDEHGDPVTSCAVVQVDAGTTGRRFKSPQGPTQKLVHNALGRLLRESGQFGRSGAPGGRPCVDLEVAMLKVAEDLPCRADQRQFQARRAITAMVAKGMYQVSEGWLWDCQ